MNPSARMRLVIAAFALLGVADPAAAQTQVFGANVEGDIEAGGRIYGEKPSDKRDAKFEEYRDLPERPFLGQFHLRLSKPDESYSFEFDGSKWGQQDQEFSLETGRLGLWQFQFDWDQTPHIFSTDARMLATEPSRGVFTLPTPRPTPLTLYNSGKEIDEISTRWDTARMSFRLTPTPDLELKAEYMRIKKDGDRPLGMAFGSPGNNFLEILEPIDQTIHDFRLQGTLAREQWQLQFGYTLSIFDNALTRVRADNPCFGRPAALPAGCGAGDGGPAAPATGQSSLPPDNTAHTFSLAGGMNLPMRTRLTGNFSYSLWLQNDTFLPHTINPAFGSNPGLVLPRRSLDGNVQVFLVNLNGTAHPLPPLTLSAKYRLYDFHDLSDEIVFPAHAENDQSLVTGARRAGRFEFTRHNADLDARWQLMRPVAFTVGTGWERWVRNEHREVPETDEFSGKAVLDVTLTDWLLLQAKYVPSFRRINEYNSKAHAAHTVVEDPVALSQGQSVLLRKYDEAERDRQRVDLLFQLTPLETLSATPTVGYRSDEYINSELGLKREDAWSAGVDLNWNPLRRLSVYTGYVYELNFQKQLSRSRPVITPPGLGFDFVDYDWISDNTDIIHTFRGGVTTTLIPQVLDWTLDANYSTATGTIETRNPTLPTSGTAATRASAKAQRMPAFDDNLLRLETALRYHFWKNWTASLGYIFESFDKHDWRTDTLNPFVPGVSSIWLGNDLKNYSAHIILVTLGYHFK